jgi:hypothetical protein
VTSRLQLLSFGETLVVLDTRASQVFAYGGSARHVWDALAAGVPADEVLAAIQAEAPDMTGLVRDLLDQWREFGWLADSEPPTRALEVSPDEIPLASAPARWASAWTFEVSGLGVSVSAERLEDSERIRTLFRHFERPVPQVDLALALRPTPDGQTALLSPAGEILRSADMGLVIGAVHQAILERLYRGVDWLALMHAGAVALDGAAVAFPAQSGSGKTTLTAALMAGEFDYLADDLVAVMATTGAVAPWRMPLSIKAGSWPVLSALHPALLEAPEYETKGSRARLLIPKPDTAPATPVPLKALVFPRFRAGSRLKLARLEPVDALARLLNDRVWLGHPLSGQGVQRFLDWLQRTPAYALEYDDLGDAAEAVKSVLRP